MTSTRRRQSRGIGTAEVLVGAVLSLMTLAAIASFFQVQQKSSAAQSVYAQSQTVTRTVIDLFSRELRMATYKLAANPGPCCPGFNQGIVSASATSVRFRADLNGDGDTADANEDVTYALSGTSINRTDGANPAVALVTGVPAGGLGLRYYNNNNPPGELVPAGSPAVLSACQLACVAKVQISITANLTNPDPHITTPIASKAESQIAIRNRSLTNF